MFWLHKGSGWLVCHHSAT